jgi:hypothetical protein
MNTEQWTAADLAATINFTRLAADKVSVKRVSSLLKMAEGLQIDRTIVDGQTVVKYSGPPEVFSAIKRRA